MNSFIKLTGSLSFVLLALSATAHDVSDKGVKQTTLKHVMRGLLNDSQQISEGIFLQRFNQIEQAALKIANHATPSIEIKQKLAKNLGPEMGVFKNYDIKVHDTATALAKAANEKDMKLVVIEYHQLVDGCQSCHGSFKKRVSKILE